MPVACAITEVVSTDTIKNICTIHGQVTLAFPISFKEFLLTTPTIQLPPVISFKFSDNSSQIKSADISRQMVEIAK